MDHIDVTHVMETEGRIQQDIVRWYRNEYCRKPHEPRCLIMSIPNSKNPLLREVGMMSGASDLIVVHREVFNKGLNIGTNIYFVEIKTPEGRQSPAQKKFQEHIEQMHMTYVVIRSLEEFKELVL